MKYFLTAEQAEQLLPEGDTVHTFYNNGPMLTGADWSRNEIIDKLKHSDHIELTGESARAMKHGMCAYNDGAKLSNVLFIETVEEKVAALESTIEPDELKPCPLLRRTGAAQRTERTICGRMHKEMRRNSDICRQGQSDRNMEQEDIKCAYFQPNR